MAIKEMPLKEKHDRLLDEYLLDAAIHCTIHKETGTVDKAKNLMLQAS